MHVSKILSKKKSGKTYTTILIQESYRAKDGPRKVTLANISHLPQNFIEALEKMIHIERKGKRAKVVEDISAPEHIDTLHKGHSLQWGGIAVFRAFLHRSGMEDALKVMPMKTRTYVIAMLAQRIFQPNSKLQLKNWIKETLLPEVLGVPFSEFNENRIYRAMDELEPYHAKIEKALFRHTASDSAINMVLYDLSSIYTEGSKGCALHTFGKSSNHRQDRKQIFIGLVTDTNGMPLTFHMLRGNRTSVKSLIPCMEKIKRRFGIKKITFISDGGFASEENLNTLTERGYSYLTRINCNQIKNLLEESKTEVQPDIFDRQFQVFEYNQKRYCLCHSESREIRDTVRRTSRIKKMREEYRKFRPGNKSISRQTEILTKKLLKTKTTKYFSIEEDREKGRVRIKINKETIREEANRDGKYLLVCTDESIADDKILYSYKQLKNIEDDFKIIKSIFEVRPMYHWKLKRVHGHLLICFLSLWLERWLENYMKKRGINESSIKLLRDLQRIEQAIIKIGTTKRRLPLTVMLNMTDERSEILSELHCLQLVEKGCEIQMKEGK